MKNKKVSKNIIFGAILIIIQLMCLFQMLNDGFFKENHDMFYVMGHFMFGIVGLAFIIYDIFIVRKKAN